MHWDDYWRSLLKLKYILEILGLSSRIGASILEGINIFYLWKCLFKYIFLQYAFWNIWTVSIINAIHKLCGINYICQESRHLLSMSPPTDWRCIKIWVSFFMNFLNLFNILHFILINIWLLVNIKKYRAQGSCFQIRV